MPVYIDPQTNCAPNTKWRGSVVTHLFADTVDELHVFAGKIGLNRSWFQVGSLPHYDLTPSKRALAICEGVVILDRKQAVAKWREIRAGLKA